MVAMVLRTKRMKCCYGILASKTAELSYLGPYNHPFLAVLNGISLAKYIKFWGNGDKSKTTGRFEKKEHQLKEFFNTNLMICNLSKTIGCIKFCHKTYNRKFPGTKK